MDTSVGDSQVLAALAESVCSDPDVVFAVAFGSQITGAQTHASDIDIAVKFADALSPSDRFEAQCVLSGTLQQEDLPFVDVSDIEALPLEVAHDAVNGELLCGDRQAFAQFKAAIEDTYDAQRETLRRHQRSVIDRIAEDGLRG